MTAGVLVVDKPAGPTSHDIVAVARRALGERRIGHCGTLDPMATGVLALAVGPATRLVRFLSSARKTYDASIRFGVTTTTFDVTGATIATSTARPIAADVARALAPFTGVVMQRPPAFSAKKVGGARAYELAREDGGSGVILEPVAVELFRLEVQGFDGHVLRVSMEVSAGFYVRSLAHDLGQALGMGATLEALRRTRSGDFSLDDAVSVEALATGDRAALERAVVPLPRLLPACRVRRLDAREVSLVRHGQDVPDASAQATRPRGDADADATAVVRLLGPGGDLIGLAEPGRAPGTLHPFVVLG